MNKCPGRTWIWFAARVLDVTRRLAPALVLSSGFAVAQQVGYVLEVKGEWRVHGRPKPLVAGDTLMAAVMLENIRPSNVDRIVVADLNGEIIKRMSCENGVCSECSSNDQCLDPIRPLPAAPSRLGAVATGVKAAMSLLSGDRGRYSALRVRSSDRDRYSALRVRSGELQEAVVLLKGGELYLGPVFVRHDPDRYYVALNRIDHDREKAKPGQSRPIALDWRPGTSGAVAVGQLSPGLYELILLEASPIGYRTTTNTAWVLASSMEKYAEATAAFREASIAVTGWGADVSPETSRAFARAYLEQLSGTVRDAQR